MEQNLLSQASTRKRRSFLRCCVLTALFLIGFATQVRADMTWENLVSYRGTGHEPDRGYYAEFSIYYYDSSDLDEWIDLAYF
ncbi:hypothetical protein LJB95_03325, partial [Paludibacteraceae bacterium OttesenSCG-928-F17]|nr:hypothetical protein [Paludibacteraceae bacterium OttesenSCG-928-F17]